MRNTSFKKKTKVHLLINDIWQMILSFRHTEFWVLCFLKKVEIFGIQMEINFHTGCTMTSICPPK